MELITLRRHFKETYTIGRFIIDGKYFSETLEDPVRKLTDLNNDGDFTDNGEGKIYGETAIPAGRYKVIVTDSPKLKRRLPLLVDVPGYTGVRIHAGSSAKGTEGCILVGKNTKPGRLTDGPYYEAKLIELIDEATKRGDETYITVK